MPVIRQYKCDGCGNEKREANHWWALWITAGCLQLEKLERSEIRGINAGMEVLCGQECVSKKVSEFMGVCK